MPRWGHDPKQFCLHGHDRIKCGIDTSDNCKCCVKRHRRNILLKKYGLNEELFKGLFESQDGQCAICLRSERKLQIDHDHVTGKVRGLLCGECNRAIGSLNDSQAALLRAVEYLNESR